MQMTVPDLEAWNTRQCPPGRLRSFEGGPGTAPSGMGIDNENDQVS
jgi:hypothetical protein